MATIVLASAGGALGASAGSSLLGLSTAVVGKAVGAAVGRMVDNTVLGSVMGGGSQTVEQGRLDRLRLTSAGEGQPIPQIYGRTRVPAHVIWSAGFREHVTEVENSAGGSGKGARPQAPGVTQRTFTYTVSLALGICEGRIARIGRIWADGQEIDRDDLAPQVYEGGQDQLPDPLIEATEGTDAVPAFRGLAYVVLEDLDLSPFGNRVPQFSFEVVRNEWTGNRRDLAHHVHGVALIPGTGEYSLATTPVRYEFEPGVSRYANVHTRTAATDFAAALEGQKAEIPRSKAVSLVVSWFGGDLRCSLCLTEPKVEDVRFDGREMPWRAGGINRDRARMVPRLDGEPVYGGTPSDQSVVEAIRALTAAGRDVMFYPFILMDQLNGNGKTDPHGGIEQPRLPWRGRITTSIAPGRSGSPDGTSEADAEVTAYLGSARAEDFSVSWTRDGPDGQRLPTSQVVVSYHGPEEWSYRRFILHYAHLCAAAGGIESFCIGSELRGLTQIRGADGFPMVAGLKSLAGEVRGILGPDVKISYAADWSEYFGYHPQDGSGGIFFHLDPLWSHPDIDFIGIDNYMPLSDWRAREDERDADWQFVHNLDYLKANILGGEGYDWFYADVAARASQDRTPITDGAYGEPWVFRYKDLVSWWSLPHHDRPDGKRRDIATEWVPMSKPIRFTELGCAAIDKGTNQPNKFLDPKSSELTLPHYSSGRRDDYIQVQYLRAHSEFWRDPRHNPDLPRYAGRMLDVDRSYVWTWDARPYPQFPGRRSVWSDGPNYDCGHWLTGRAGSRTLASVVEEICHRSGLEAVDVDRLVGVVRGFVVGEIGDARAALQPLMLSYGFDAIERDGGLLFRMRDARVAGPVDPSQIVENPNQSGDLFRTRAPEAEQRDRISIGYVGSTEGFEAASTEAIFPGDRSETIARTELPLVLLDTEAKDIAERWLAEARVAQDRIRFGLPPSRSDLGAGDVIEVLGGHYRIDRVEQSEFQQIEAVRVEPAIYDRPDVVADIEPGEGRPHGAEKKRSPSGPPLTTFLDLPLLTGEEVPHAPHIAAASRPWPGNVAVYASPEDAGYRLDTVLASPATLGTTETPLEAGPVGTVDRGDPLRIRLVSGEFSSAGEEAVLAGANAMAIGSGTDDRWEILQFRDAALVGERTWNLSTRLRGQLGTDAFMPEVWPVGSRIVLLNGALRQIGLKAAFRGVARHYRIGPGKEPLGSTSYVHAERAFAGAGLRPYSPVWLSADRMEDGLRISWIRRTRIGGDEWGELDVPIGEEREAYRVRILRDGGVLREAIVDEPHWFYEGVAQQADGQGRAYAEVAQLSALYGAGPAGRMELMLD